MAFSKKDKYYKIQIDAKAKAPEIKTQTIKYEKLSAEQCREYEETKKENRGKATWLMPSGSIFWAGAGMEINSAKKIVFKAKGKAKAKKATKSKAKTKRKKKKT